MAEGVLRHYGHDLEVYSAGSVPAGLNPLAVEVMREIGIDISGQRSKHVSEFQDQRFDYIITVCDHAKEFCPVFPGRFRKIHWGFPDPPHGKERSEKVLNEFRRVRDLIHSRFKRAAEKGFEPVS